MRSEPEVPTTIPEHIRPHCRYLWGSNGWTLCGDTTFMVWWLAQRYTAILRSERPDPPKVN
jgi:hypothetical protein